ncbi:MAG: hypothetical protein IBX72_02150 [Nitrospirae bacterium]|jgi:nickel transport protein|nr:hypothetical protein [Nitrospirota bacterium]
MKHFLSIIVIILGIAGVSSMAIPHTVHYHIENKGISVRVFYAEDDPASYSSYEIFGPGDTIPHQKGRTDRNGFVSFLPDRQGKWIVEVQGESEHGLHSAQIEVTVDEDLFMESFKKPLVARYITGFIGISFILAVFGIWALLKSRKSAP